MHLVVKILLPVILDQVIIHFIISSLFKLQISELHLNVKTLNLAFILKFVKIRFIISYFPQLQIRFELNITDASIINQLNFETINLNSS